MQIPDLPAERSVKIVVVGPGAIGCLFAGLLIEGSEAGDGGSAPKVWLLDKDPARAARISQQGIILESSSGSRSIDARITANPSEIGASDMVLLCVKAYDTTSAMMTARPVLCDHTIVVSMQNGIGNAEKIADVVARDGIVCGITAHGSTSLGPGQVRHSGSGPSVVAPFLPDCKHIALAAANTLSSVGIETHTAQDARRMIWSKLVVNAAINPVTALANVRNGDLLANEALRDRMSAAAREAAAVAEAAGIRLDYDDAVSSAEKLCTATAENYSSMLQDIRMNRRTEIESITGAIVQEAHHRNVDVPVSEELLASIRSLETESN
jgi:2-dehydropantoate 2-reductase